MKQFVLREDPDANGEVTLTGDDHHYLARVRRLLPGSRLACRLPGGGILEAVVKTADSRSLTLAFPLERLADQILITPEGASMGAPAGIHLFPGLLKAQKLDLVIRQAVELGVTGIYPCIMRHCDIEARSRIDQRMDRWRKIIREAQQQSGASLPCQLGEPAPLIDQLKVSRNHVATWQTFFFHESARDSSPLHQTLDPGSGLWQVVIGPEGGLSADETDFLVREKGTPVWLGPRVLRAETAAIAALGTLNQLLLEEHAWRPAIPS